MPYSSNADLPNYVKKYSENIQSQWRHVWTSVYASTKDEVRAVKAANSILKKRFTGNKSMEKNSREDYFSHLVDRFLKNLDG